MPVLFGHKRGTSQTGSDYVIITSLIDLLSKAPLAHAWLEQRTHNPLVRGSTPRGGTKKTIRFYLIKADFMSAVLFLGQPTAAMSEERGHGLLL